MQGMLCSALLGWWKFPDPRCHGPDINFLLAAQTSLPAPTYSQLGLRITDSLPLETL